MTRLLTFVVLAAMTASCGKTETAPKGGSAAATGAAAATGPRAVDVVRPLKEYIVQLVTVTRSHSDIVVGVSPRGGAALQRCAQAMALIRGRTFVTPDDIKIAAPAVLSHRLLTRDRQAATAREIIAQVLSEVTVPVD